MLTDRRIHKILPENGIYESLFKKDKKLNVYLGIDPTAPKIHLGHAVPLFLLRKFIEAGHNVTLLFGDFTALIGDTSDKDSERPVLTESEINMNLASYAKQASKIIDLDKVNLVKNSQWLSKLKFEEIIRLCQHFSVGDFVGRELIKKRLSDGKRVGLHETLYPIMQGFDSYKLKTDVQIGGMDQTFNMLAGRELIKDLENRESVVMCTDYLPGTDGRKMSKTWGNAIWLEDEAFEMYGKIMSISDDLILTYFKLATEVSDREITSIKEEIENGKNPMEFKKHLANEIVKTLHNSQLAQEARDNFESTYQKKEAAYSPKPVTKAYDTVIMFVGFIEGSNSAAKRLIAANAIEVNGQLVNDPAQKLNEGDKIKIGKRKFFKVMYV